MFLLLFCLPKSNIYLPFSAFTRGKDRAKTENHVVKGGKL